MGPGSVTAAAIKPLASIQGLPRHCSEQPLPANYQPPFPTGQRWFGQGFLHKPVTLSLTIPPALPGDRSQHPASHTSPAAQHSPDEPTHPQLSMEVSRWQCCGRREGWLSALPPCSFAPAQSHQGFREHGDDLLHALLHEGRFIGADPFPDEDLVCPFCWTQVHSSSWHCSLQSFAAV